MSEEEQPQAEEAEPKRRRTDVVFEERLTKLEDEVREMKESLGALKDIRDIMEEGRAAFRLASRIASLLRSSTKFTIRIVAPLVALYVILYAATHGGNPPVWFANWLQMWKDVE